MIDTQVRSFFDTTLRTVLLAEGVETDADVSVGGQVAWPGQAFDSTIVSESLPWFQTTYIPFEPRAAGIGSLAQNKMRGLYEVECYGATKGNYTEQDIIDLLAPVCEAFKRGVQFTDVGVCVTCTQSWIFRSQRDTLTARWVVSARVKWEAYLNN